MQQNHGQRMQVCPLLVIRPSSGWVSLKLRDVWEYRELLYFLTWRDIKVRYKQTALGGSLGHNPALVHHARFQPVFLAGSGKYRRMESLIRFLPLRLSFLGASLPTDSLIPSDSLVSSANLVKKVYFPRLVLPISAVISGGVDFVLAFVLLLGMMLYFGIVPTINIFWLPCSPFAGRGHFIGSGTLVFGTEC